MTSLAFKVKSKNGQQILKDLTSESTVGELKMFLSRISDVSLERICVLCGYPPKPLDISNDSKKIIEIGLKTGESLIVEEKSAPIKENIKKLDAAKPVENGVSHETIGPCRPGILMKKVVPSDNSCLFTSIGFVLNGNVDTTVHTLMRQIIAMEVASDHDTYNEGVLGRPNAEYCAWIQQPSSWGGAIEVAILSRFYGLEMAVVDTLNAIINRFGEDKNYGQRVFLLFDGVHYDPLYLEQSDECTYDHVTIYDGASADEKTLGRFCGSKLPHPVVASQNQMYVVFKSDASVQRKGFLATYSTACGGYLAASETVKHVYSHARYGHDSYESRANCDWSIVAPMGQFVRLTFLTFELEPEANCDYDFVQVFGGLEGSAGDYGSFCGSKMPPQIVSTTEALLLRFRTDDSIVFKGFSASYEAVKPDVWSGEDSSEGGEDLDEEEDEEMPPLVLGRRGLRAPLPRFVRRPT